MLRIITANRQEPLLAHLAAQLGPAAGGDPLKPDLLVAERGTDRWLWQFLAETHGVAANLRFEQPAGFLWRMLRLYRPDAPADARFDPAPLAWRIARLLPRLLAQREFAPLAGYLAGDDGRKLHQLTARIAATFNDYLVYRPEMVTGWEQGRLATAHADERWQQQLWLAITAETGTEHRAGLLQDFLQQPDRARPAALPARVAVFGIPALPPVYVATLLALGGQLDIDLYVFNPCREFWGELGDPRRLNRLPGGDIDGSDLGNPLLAAWGQPVRHFISELYGHEAELLDLSVTLPSRRTLLQRLQDDIHGLKEVGAGLAADDDSLRITSAWGALREVEILHDELMHRFQRDGTLKPRDVLVMVPDIERYAPAIEAVFGAADGARHIPWSITDVPLRATQPVTAAVEQLLRLPDSRFAASEVLGLLETPAVARRFRLDGDATGRLREALRRAGLHGELDGAARAARGLPADPAHSWQFALQRLFLGIAMDEQPAPVLGVLPEPAFEGQDSALAGRLQAFIERLAQWQPRLARPQLPDAWLATLHALIEDFFAADDDEQAALDEVLKAVRAFLDETQAGDYAEPLPPPVFRDNLLARLRAPASRGNLRTGGVVFCGLVPMRSLPWRMIALLGMNGDAFPRQQRTPGFDLIGLSPRAGDRSRRHDDRHLFLETLLSARDALYISYSGRSPQDSSRREPSVLVRELLDQVVATHGGEAARQAIESQLVVEHPLQPFSARYFAPAADGTAPLPRYDADWIAPARAAATGQAPRAPFCPQPLPPPEGDAVTDIALDRLARYFEHPARGFLRERFGISLYDEDRTFDDHEPFALDGLTAAALRLELLEARLAGAGHDPLQARLHARGDLPQARFGELAWQALASEVEPFVQALAPLLAEQRALDIDLVIDTDAGPRRLHGRLDALAPAHGQLLYRVTALRDRHLLAAWIRHLALLAAAPAGVAPQTLLVARGDAGKGQPVQTLVLGNGVDARAELAHLIALFEAGRCAPLPLLPPCSRAFALHDDEAAALRAAHKAWEGDRYNRRPGERDDAAVRIVFGDDAPPFDAAFIALGRRLYVPLHAALGGNAAGDDDA